MTWTVTLDSGDRNVVLPNGLRYQGSAEVVLSDQWYGQLTATAVSGLLTAVPAGGEASYTVTLASGLENIVLPNGLRYSAGDTADLSDEQYSVIPAAVSAALFSSVQVTVG